MRHVSTLLFSVSIALGSLFLTSAQAAPPNVSLTSPSDGATWAATSTLSVSANATDADGTISIVEFYLDNLLVGSSTQPLNGTLGTFTANLSPRPAGGTYVLTARAYDNSGLFASSSPRALMVASLPLPVVVTGAASVGSTVAGLHGTINPNGIYTNPLDVYFEFGLSTNYGGVSATSRIRVPAEEIDGNTAIPIVRGVSDLERGTTYHYRMVARNAAGTSYGEDATFTTLLNLPPVAEDVSTNLMGAQSIPIHCYFGDPDSEPVSITSVSIPSHGTVTFGSPVAGADLMYTPDSLNVVTDEFTYTVSDEHGGTATATVRLFNLRATPGGRFVTTIVTDGGPLRAVGALALNVTSGSYFSGVVSFFGARYPIKGRFSTDGSASLEIDRLGDTPIIVNLGQWGGANGVAIGGNLTASSRSYEILNDVALATPEDAPEKGSYTMSLPADDPSAPVGNGYVTGRVTKHGQVVFTGLIGDGQPFGFGTQLRRDGSAQLSVTAGVEPRDRLHGRVQFPGAGETECTGSLSWYRAPRTSGAYQGGFRSNVDVVGSRLQTPQDDEPILEYSGQLAGLEIVMTDLEDNELLKGLLSGANEQALTFDESSLSPFGSARLPAKASNPTVLFKINRLKGTFRGTFQNPNLPGKQQNFSGVLLQHQNSGSGLLRFGKRTGSVTLTPN